MKLRSLLAALIILCLFIGGGVVYMQRPQGHPSDEPVVFTQPDTLSFFDLDTWDRYEAQRLTPEEIDKIKKKSGQRMVNGMVEIKQDQLPTTVVVQQDFFIDKIIFDGDGSCQEINVTTTQGPVNIGVISCKITKTAPAPSCDVTVSGQLAGPGGPPSPPPPGPPPGNPPSGPGNPPC